MKNSDDESEDEVEFDYKKNDLHDKKQRVETRDQLEERCDVLTRENTRLKAELRKAQTKSRRMTKGGMRTYNEWNAKEANLSDRISSFCGSYVFRRYKFLKDGWETYKPDNVNSLSSFFKRKVVDVHRDDYEDEWERIYVPSISSKFKTLRCNLNNTIREQYKGKSGVSDLLCILFVLIIVLSNSYTQPTQTGWDSTQTISRMVQNS